MNKQFRLTLLYQWLSFVFCFTATMKNTADMTPVLGPQEGHQALCLSYQVLSADTVQIVITLSYMACVSHTTNLMATPK